MKVLRLFCVFMSAFVLLLQSGCSVEEMEELLGLNVPREALFVLSFHRPIAYPRGNLQSELLIRMPDGSSKFVERYPDMSSHHIVEITAKPVAGNPGFYRLQIRPNQKGRAMWMQMTAQYQHEPAIILLDGVYLGEFRSSQLTNEASTWVELPLDIDGARALNIVKYANDNYRFFNGGSREDKNDILSDFSNR